MRAHHGLGRHGGERGAERRDDAAEKGRVLLRGRRARPGGTRARIGAQEREREPLPLEREGLAELRVLALKVGGLRAQRDEAVGRRRAHGLLLVRAAANHDVVEGMRHEQPAVGGGAQAERVALRREHGLAVVGLHAAHLIPADELLARACGAGECP